jgi:hypothetical protein
VPGGKGKIKGTDGNTFSKDNQPSGESKSKGRIKKYLLRDIAQQLLTGDSKDAIQDLARYLGIDPDQIDIETAMHLKQMERALKEGDTKAYNAVMDRVKGKPVQAIEISEHQIKPIRLVAPDANK